MLSLRSFICSASLSLSAIMSLSGPASANNHREIIARFPIDVWHSGVLLATPDVFFYGGRWLNTVEVTLEGGPNCSFKSSMLELMVVGDGFPRNVDVQNGNQFAVNAAVGSFKYVFVQRGAVPARCVLSFWDVYSEDDNGGDETGDIARLRFPSSSLATNSTLFKSELNNDSSTSPRAKSLIELIAEKSQQLSNAVSSENPRLVKIRSLFNTVQELGIDLRNELGDFEDLAPNVEEAAEAFYKSVRKFARALEEVES